MKTTLYLIRHGATEANLSKPPWLQGRRRDLPLAWPGVRQAEATRDLLADRPLDCCYCSPLLRAVQTAMIVALPHRLAPIVLEGLTECDVGRWEGLDWGRIRAQDAEAYCLFMENPAEHGYPGGESYAETLQRAQAVLDTILARHEGRTILVVGHHGVNRTYLAALMGIGPDKARRVQLQNCGISTVIREDGRTRVETLNVAFHVRQLAA